MQLTITHAICSSRGVALVMVLLVLTALAALGAPFLVSMRLQEKSSIQFEGAVKVTKAAEGARNHALDRLAATHHVVEGEVEAQEAGIFDELTASSKGRSTGRTSRRSSRGSGRPRSRRGTEGGMIIREDLGEKGPSRRDRRRTRRDASGRAVVVLPGLIESQKGAPEKLHDPPQDLDVALPGTVVLPATAPRLAASSELDALVVPDAVTTSRGGDVEISFADLRGLLASARVVDEQGKVNINTAPANLIANLFAVSVLVAPLDTKDEGMRLEDASAFPSDGDPRTIDGAVMVVPPGQNWGEAITYRERRGNELRGLFRRAFFSRPARTGRQSRTIPTGTFVYDLRGWKIANHKLRAGAVRGFETSSLREFATVEAIREVANWQLASLFLSRLHGAGLTPDFLSRNGLRTKDLQEIGLDPALFESDERYTRGAMKAELEAARRTLRRLRVTSTGERLLKARGPRALVSFAARVEPLTTKEAREEAKQIDAVLKKSRRRDPAFDRDYLEAALSNLAEVYGRPGIETIRPQDLEFLRNSITVSSRVAAKWSEPQTIQNAVLAADPSEEEKDLKVARPGHHGGGSFVRVRNRKSSSRTEYNQSQGGGPNGFRFLFPLYHSYGPGEALIDFLERHPVNANTASERVLRAVFTGVASARIGKRKRDEERGGEITTPGWVTPREAKIVTARVFGSRPISGPQEFWDLLSGCDIDPEDVQPLYLNSIQPNHHELSVSTTGLCYATGDVYTIESRGILRNPAGGEVLQKGFREIVEVSPARPLRWTLFSQRDLTTEVFFRDPYRSIPSPLGFPEDHYYNAVSFPGMQGHLVRTTPIHYRIRINQDVVGDRGSVSSFAVPGAENGTLRLETPETIRDEFTLNDIEHFREGRNETLELPGGEPYPIDISLGGGGGGGRGGGLGLGGVDLTTVPAAIEAWVRFKTFPGQTSKDGLLILLDAGVEEDRNRISLLYDRRSSEWVARIWDSALPDPTIPRSDQFYEIRARRPLELDTWYHFRLVWNGTYSGGVQLFLDGMPVGQSNYTAELAGGISLQSAAVPGLQGFPQEGVVRVGSELIDYVGGSVPRMPQSFFETWLATQITTQQGGNQPLPPGVPPPVTPAIPLTGGVPPPSLRRGSLGDDAGNSRGSVRSDHAAGATVALHGYSLKIMRKLYRRLNATTSAVYQAGANDIVLGRGNLTLADDLYPFRLPKYLVTGTTGGQQIAGGQQNAGGRQEEEIWLIHYNEPLPPELVQSPAGTPGGTPGGGGPSDGGVAGRRGTPGGTPGTGTPGTAAANQQVFAPMFRYPFRTYADFQPAAATFNCLQTFPQNLPPQTPVRVYSAKFSWGGQIFDAWDFFQGNGVLRAAGHPIRYTKTGVPLPPGHPATTPVCWLRVVRPLVGAVVITPDQYNPSTDRVILGFLLCEAQTRGLQAQSAYPNGQVDPNLFRHGPRLDLISVAASGTVQGLYPNTGVLHMRGSPAPWHQRPDYGTAANVFQYDPDDTTEWFRYHHVEGNLFIGNTGSNTNRDYPRGWNHMFHRRGAVIGQVVELADGGAGLGDYASISTNDPSVRESRVHRVYRVLERADGRFFVSLFDPATGRPSTFQNAYPKSLNPRLVKFPTGAPPQIGSGQMVFFGDAVRGSFGGAGGLGGFSGTQDVEEEFDSGFVVDEIRRTVYPPLKDYYVAARQNPQSDRSQFVRFALVPLESGRVKRIQTGDGGETLGGVIAKGRSISRSNPMEVLVVTVSDAGGGSPFLFARGLERGALRINDELFFFENPNVQQGGASVAQGAQGQGVGRGRLASVSALRTTTQPQPGAQGATQQASATNRRGQRNPRDRTTRYSISGSVSGPFENEGFALIQFGGSELHGFREIFYYQSRGGGTFSNCLRGQFQTSLITDVEGDGNQLSNHGLRNVTMRLRLIGRSLLGTLPQTHGFGDPVSLVPGLPIIDIRGPLTDTGLPVTSTRNFPSPGYLLIDSMNPNRPFEILAYKGIFGPNLFMRPRDESGKGILRGCFGTVPGSVAQGMFAYALPFRHFDRYEPKVESEDLAYFQKSFREPGAFWRRITWKEREPRNARERLHDIVVAVRFDGEPDWSVTPTNKEGGLFVFDDQETRRDRAQTVDLGVAADQLDLRVYFRYRNGAFQRVSRDHYRDDWKETPVLDALMVEYEKAGRIVRHEETRF